MHRPDIDGLRAIAVGAVIANHFSDSILPGGYLGVDIFFVISGFVITLSLLRQSEPGFTSFLLDFYQRRIRRIFPALLACIALTAPLFALFTQNAKVTLMTGAASTFAVSNFYLLLVESDYFAIGSKLNGYTHTWSLGIEEQFYLLYPALFWLLLRQRKQSAIVLSVLIAVSLAGFVYVERTSPVAAFYMLPYRAWELSIGALLAFRDVAKPLKFARAGSGLGALLLCFSLAMPSTMAVPGTLCAVAGTGLLIRYGGAIPSIDRFLRSSVIQWTGKVSYSLYLWHWPVLVLSRWTVGIHWWLAPAQLAVMLALAAASHRFVEQPFRRPPPGEKPIATVLAALALCAALALGLRHVAHLPQEKAFFAGQPISANVRENELLGADYTIPGHGTWHARACMFTHDNQSSRPIDRQACTLGDDSAGRRALVIGNSFAASFVEGFAPLVREEGYSVTLFASLAASPTPSIPNESAWSQANLAMWNRVYPDLLQSLSRGDLVILSSDMIALAPEPDTAKGALARSRFDADLRTMSEQLRRQGVRLAVMHTLPFFERDDCKLELATQQWFMPFGSPCTFPSRSEQLARRAPVERILREREAAGDIAVIDLFDLFCPGKSCAYTRPDVGFLYRDEAGHPSIAAMPHAGGEIVRQLRQSGAIAQ